MPVPFHHTIIKVLKIGFRTNSTDMKRRKTRQQNVVVRAVEAAVGGPTEAAESAA